METGLSKFLLSFTCCWCVGCSTETEIKLSAGEFNSSFEAGGSTASNWDSIQGWIGRAGGVPGHPHI